MSDHSTPQQLPESPESKQAKKTVVRHETTIAEWSGPLPPPAIIEAYERLHPGMAARIFDAFESEQKHRQQMERQEILLQEQALRYMASDNRRGHWLGFILAGIMVVMAFTTSLLGLDKSVSLGFLVPAFVSAIAAIIYAFRPKNS